MLVFSENGSQLSPCVFLIHALSAQARLASIYWVAQIEISHLSLPPAGILRACHHAQQLSAGTGLGNKAEWVGGGQT